MKITLKAGAIVLAQRDPRLVALLYRGKQGDWSFPKGHVEEREVAADTMQREVAEETGLHVETIGTAGLPPMEYTDSKGDPVSVQMFLMRSTNDADLKTENADDSIAWLHYREVIERLSYENTKVYFESILPMVKRAVASLTEHHPLGERD